MHDARRDTVRPLATATIINIISVPYGNVKRTVKAKTINVRAQTPQERGVALLAGLARLGENKFAIASAGGIAPLVLMLSSEAPEVLTSASCALWHLSATGPNKMALAEAGAIPALVALLSVEVGDVSSILRHTTGTLWNLCAFGDTKAAMVAAGAIAPLVVLLRAQSAEARENAAAVVSALARSQGGTKKALVSGGSIPPLVELLGDASILTQKHAACGLWGLCEGKEGTYHKDLIDHGAVQPLIELLLLNHPETRGFAAACLSCICVEHEDARRAVLDAGGAQPLTALAYSPSAWLQKQSRDMLQLLGVPFTEPEPGVHPHIEGPAAGGGRLGAAGAAGVAGASAASGASGGAGGGSASAPSERGATGHPLVATKALPIRRDAAITLEEGGNPILGGLEKGQRAWVVDTIDLGNGLARAKVATALGEPGAGWVTSQKEGVDFLVPETALWEAAAARPLVLKHKFHFFSFQIHHVTGAMGHPS